MNNFYSLISILNGTSIAKINSNIAFLSDLDTQLLVLNVSHYFVVLITNIRRVAGSNKGRHYNDFEEDLFYFYLKLI